MMLYIHRLILVLGLIKVNFIGFPHKLLLLQFHDKGQFSYVVYNGSYYLKVFDHNHTRSPCFRTESEALKSNSYGKFSILYKLYDDDFKFTDNQYYFIIEYPDFGLYNSWSQELNPLEDDERHDSTSHLSKGFQQNETQLVAGRYWGGLAKTTLDYNNVINSLLDGNPGTSNFWYAIGMYCNTLREYIEGGIPANGSLVSRVRLYARIKSIDTLLTENNNLNCICTVMNVHPLYLKSSFFVFI